MLHKIKNLCYPMRNIENKTMAEYLKIRNFSISIFLIAIQFLYTMLDGEDHAIFGYVFNSNTIEEFLIGFVGNVIAYAVIHFVISVIWQWVWIGFNADNCYLAGTWYYVYARDFDKGKDYARAGFLTLEQNFYDISVQAHNYDVRVDAEGRLYYVEEGKSSWHFVTAEVDEEGSVKAFFKKDKEGADVKSHDGVMTLDVINHDEKGRIDMMDGITSDAGASTIRGGIRMYRLKTDRKHAKAKRHFMKEYPPEWEEAVRKQLKYNMESKPVEEI